MRNRFWLSCLGLLVFSSQARAEDAYVLFPLMPEAAEPGKNYSFETLFYSRQAGLEGVARLNEPYHVEAGNPAKGEVPAGAMLYAVHTEKAVYYCSNHALREVSAGDVAGLALLGGIPFLGPRYLPADTSPQCFRDADNDGRFDEIAAGRVWGGSLATAAEMEKARPLAISLAYEKLSGPEPFVEVGLKGRVRSARSGRFQVRACMKVRKSEFSTEEEACFHREEHDFSLKDLPKKIRFLDGEVSVTSLAAGADGVWQIRYEVPKPITAPVILRKLFQYPAAILYQLRYIPPSAQ